MVLVLYIFLIFLSFFVWGGEREREKKKGKKEDKERRKIDGAVDEIRGSPNRTGNMY